MIQVPLANPSVNVSLRVDEYIELLVNGRELRINCREPCVNGLESPSQPLLEAVRRMMQHTGGILDGMPTSMQYLTKRDRAASEITLMEPHELDAILSADAMTRGGIVGRETGRTGRAVKARRS